MIGEEAADAEEAARRALHNWHNREFTPNTTVQELEDDTARVLAVFEGSKEAELVRNPTGNLV